MSHTLTIHGPGIPRHLGAPAPGAGAPVGQRGRDKRLSGTYPIRDHQTRFDESDFACFERLCQEWGISYHFEHTEDSGSRPQDYGVDDGGNDA